MSVIDWNELKHRHVIIGFQEQLAEWFAADVFFVNDKGEPVMMDPADRSKDWKNSLSRALLGREQGREALFKAMKDANELAYRGGEGVVAVPGPLGLGHACVARINVGSDFLGSVYVGFFADEGGIERFKEQYRKVAGQLGLDPGAAETVADGIHALTSADQSKKFLLSLTGLIVKEVASYIEDETKHEQKMDLALHAGGRYSYDSMIGKSKRMQDLYSLLDKLRSSDSTVLIQGENGTGKELIAKAIHHYSQRKDKAFVTVNCSAFNENLLDSELFGHVRGSFTGAIKDKKGLFEAAHNGTLFLDEIGDMSPTMQVKLLRVLQEGTFTPVGSTEVRKADVRVLAATNRDLKEMIETGAFREDLYYRVNVINIQVPALRERKEDIPLLVDHFIRRGCKEKGVSEKKLFGRTLQKLMDYPWPGNIRELQNEVERLIVLSGDEAGVGHEMLSPKIRDLGENQQSQGLRVAGKLKDALEELEKTMIKEGLKRTNWNKSRLAKELGISRAGLIMKVEKYGLDKRKIARAGGSAA